MKKRKMIAVGLVLLILLQLLTACAGMRYGADLYSYVGNWVDEDFLKENTVRGAFYRNERYSEELFAEEFVTYDDAPSSRTFIITTEEEYTAILPQSTVAVNFEKQMVILHIRPDMSPREYRLKQLELNEGVLTVNIKLKSNFGEDDAVMTYARCFMLVLKKLDITDATFEKIK